MSRLTDIINDTSSNVVLECTRGHWFQLRTRIGFPAGECSYAKGERLPRNVIAFSPLHIGCWKIAAEKYQKQEQDKITRLKKQYSKTLKKV